MTATARRPVADHTRPGVVILGPNAAIRSGLRVALEGAADCYEASTPADVFAIASQLALDVCLVVTDEEAMTSVAELSAAVPQMRIIVIAPNAHESQLLAAVRAGAVGYLSDAVEPARLPYVVRGVMRGETAIPRVLVSRLVHEIRGRAKRRQLMLARPHPIELTQREWDVLEHLSRRASTKEMSAALSISEVTVRRHIGAVMKKLHVESREAAASLLESWTSV
jgi:DNA-binding NarL/FixJ family response regulator